MSRQKNAFCTELALALVLQAPCNFYAFRASNAHPVPTRPFVQCVETESISAEQLPLNVAHILKHERFCGPLAWQQLMSAFPDCTCDARKNAFCTKSALAHILQANAAPNFHAFRSSNDHPLVSLYTSHIPGYGVAMGSDGVVLSLSLKAELLPLNAAGPLCHGLITVR